MAEESADEGGQALGVAEAAADGGGEKMEIRILGETMVQIDNLRRGFRGRGHLRRRRTGLSGHRSRCVLAPSRVPRQQPAQHGAGRRRQLATPASQRGGGSRAHPVRGTADSVAHPLRGRLVLGQTPAALQGAGAMGAPVFAFLDSWGGPDVPFDLVRSIARQPAGEVLVTFGTNFLTRFGEKEQHQQAGDAAFGGTKHNRGSLRPPGQPMNCNWSGCHTVDRQSGCSSYGAPAACLDLAASSSESGPDRSK
jgi:hypothetical protein